MVQLFNVYRGKSSRELGILLVILVIELDRKSSQAGVQVAWPGFGGLWLEEESGHWGVEGIPKIIGFLY